jgi:hypothetical protein
MVHQLRIWCTRSGLEAQNQDQGYVLNQDKENKTSVRGRIRELNLYEVDPRSLSAFLR